jgi:hypothetical protein
MKEHPILFSGPMVQAIIDGKKTQTRRLVRIDDRPVMFAKASKGKTQIGIPTDAQNVRYLGPYLKCDAGPGSDTVSARVPCPYGWPDDRLWVRETWRKRAGLYYYAADFAPDDVAALKWKPSIHMPREASRLTLEVTDVRVERLQDINEEDAAAEGVPPMLGWPRPIDPSYRLGFRQLWDQINAKRAPWSSNPWVWVISFRKVGPKS